MLVLGGVTALLGVLYAVMQHDLKRLLAYHTVENIGIIVIGLGLALAFRANRLPGLDTLALAGALLHVFNHAMFKSLLFLGSGAVLVATHERDMEHLGGLIHRMPVTAVVFLIGSVAISALPPFNGFVSEWLTFQAIVSGSALPQWLLKFAVPVVGAMLALAAALAAVCFVKVFGVVFLGRPRRPAAATAEEVGPSMLAPMAGFAAICAVVGVLPQIVLGLVRPVAATLFPDSAWLALSNWLWLAPRGPDHSSYSGLVILLAVTLLAGASGRRHPWFRLKSRPPVAGVGLRLSRPPARDAIHREQLRPADPPHLRHSRLRCARASRHAAARRYAPGATSR